ncbi:MAG: alpha/beta hydrolase [Betaproteobacteria bacterium]|nr:alpha/beta hydrolase [Betaproteobacteria bacterium]MBU6513069.1 alpha/beta hydrolase [Betaproteobacteria bacterium]MDE1955461.1 alpha/beta hydrolase [Betaproteobacteria bacterium]MDE2151814.1 alpha/beta hydrolase [Betaproteobacteria bacterium]MDE2480020.1 alpha/beta hydrolase [Betaproteobacteria bacterium]
MPSPCILLPGLLCDDAVWSAQARALGARGIACSIPDYGELDSLQAMARGVLDGAPAGRFALAGHSMGARVALEVVRLAPERVQRLALLDTGIDPLPAGEAGERERARRMELLGIARRDGMRAMGREWARGMVHPSRWDSPVFDAILDMLERKTPAVYEAQIRALLGRPDARPLLAGLACPVLLGCGRDDAWSPLARHEEMHALLPGSRLAVFEHSGHMVTMEQPEAVCGALLDWMAWEPAA